MNQSAANLVGQAAKQQEVLKRWALMTASGGQLVIVDNPYRSGRLPPTSSEQTQGSS